MSFKNQQNKLSYEYNISQNNENIINNLPLIKLIENTSSFINQQSDIILTERQYITGTTLEVFQRFENLDDNLLNFLYPYAFLETDEGFKQYDNWTFVNYTTWEKYVSTNNTITVLKMHIDGFLLTPLPGGGFSSTIAPVYVTTKIKLLNPNLRVEITNSKK